MLFQRRYPIEVEDQVIELRRSGATWAEIARQTGVSVNLARIWVRRRDLQNGVALPLPSIPRYVPTRPFKDLSKWYELRFQQLAMEMARTDDPKKLGALRAAAESLWRAFQVMRARHEDSSESDEHAMYREFLNRQAEKAKERLAQIKPTQN
jgi:hypothetical protein